MFIPCRRAILASLALSAAALLAQAQEPAASPPPPAEPPAAEPAAIPPAHSRRPVGFLIRGTVFDLQGLSVPGAELHVRRSGEKRFHWDTYANSRGEFALRVPPGNQYEVVVQCKSFSDAAQPVNAANGLDEESLVFHMAPAPGRKK